MPLGTKLALPYVDTFVARGKSMPSKVVKFAVSTAKVAAVAVALGGGGWAAWTHGLPLLQGGGIGDLAAIPTAEVRNGPFVSSVSSIGALRAERSATLGAPYEGKIIQLLEEGTRVEPGDPVIWFETEDYETDLEEAEAQLGLDLKDLEAARQGAELERIKNEYTLESERTRVEVARQEWMEAKRKYESDLALLEQQIVARTRVDETRLALLQRELNLQNAQINLRKVEENLAANLAVKEREIEKAELRVERTQRRVDEATRRIDSAIVRASTPGDISYLQIWKSGSVAKVAEGDQVWRRTNLVEIPDPSVMLAVAPVSELDMSRIEEGQRAEVELEALPGEVFHGEVISKSVVAISDPTRRPWAGGGEQGPRDFEVRIRLNGTSERFRQGMTAAVRIVLDESDSILQAPLESLAEHNGERGLWVAAPAGPQFKPVAVLMTNDNFAAIDGPVQTGDRVLLLPPGEQPDDLAPVVVEVPEEGEIAGRPTQPGDRG